MKKTLILFLVPIILCIAGKARAQADSENIAHAQNALNVVHNCDDAMRFLGLVSIPGRTQPGYYLCMANANDCKSNTDQAIYYYGKYLELQPANDSVKKRVAELSDKRTAMARSANEVRVAKEAYQDGLHGRKKKTYKGKNNKKKYVVFDDNYSAGGINFGRATGGDNAPFKNLIGFNSSFGFPVMNNKIALDFAINSDFLFTANQAWYQRAFNLQTPENVNAGVGLSEDFVFAPMYVISNRENLAWMIGPEIGVKFIYMSDPTFSYADYSFAGGNSFFSLCYGFKTTLMIGEGALVYLEYSKMNTDQVTTSASYGTTTAASHDMLKLGVCYRIFVY